jgi:hypothetical protein
MNIFESTVEVHHLQDIIGHLLPLATQHTAFLTNFVLVRLFDVELVTMSPHQLMILAMSITMMAFQLEIWLKVIHLCYKPQLYLQVLNQQRSIRASLVGYQRAHRFFQKVDIQQPKTLTDSMLPQTLVSQTYYLNFFHNQAV